MRICTTNQFKGTPNFGKPPPANCSRLALAYKTKKVKEGIERIG